MPTWNVLSDWDANGNFTGTYDDITAYVIGDITLSRGKDQIRIVSPPAAGRLTLTLNNESGLFSIENESSAIFGLVLPGRKIQIKGAGSALWTGFIDEISSDPINKTVTITALGTLSRLTGRKVSTALYQSIRTDQALGYLLDEIGWAAGDRVFSTGDSTYEWFWAAEDDAFDKMLEILDAEGPGAAIYENELGKIVFENHNYRTTQARCTASQFTFSDTDYIVSLAYDPDFKDISNECTIQVDTREAQPDQVIWELSGPIVFGNNEVKVFIIKTSDPFIDVQVPSSAPGNASQTLAPSAALTAGTFKLRFRGQTTAAINWNASLATIQTEFEGLSTVGAGNVVITGSLATSLLFTFLGALGGQEITDLIEVVESSLNPQSVTGEIVASPVQDGDGTFIEIQSIAPAQPLASGSFTVTTPNGTTATLQYNDSAATLQTALRNVFGLGTTVCTGGPINTSSILLRFADITIDWALVTINPTSLTSSVGTATINVTQSALGGESDYTITAGALASKTLTEITATSAKLTLTAGASGLTLNRVRVPACPVTVVRTEQVKNNNDMSASIAKYGNRPVSHRVPPTVSRATAQTLANSHAGYYPNPRANVVFDVDNKNGTIEAQQIAGLISDRVTVNESHTGIADPYFREHIAHRLIAPDIIWTTFGCEKAL